MTLLDTAPVKPVGLLCPSCRVTLVMSDRQGVEIDYCPQCRGVWLDRGELDKIVERSLPAAPQARDGADRDRSSQRYDDDRGHGDDRGHARRRKSWLSEIFD